MTQFDTIRTDGLSGGKGRLVNSAFAPCPGNLANASEYSLAISTRTARPVNIHEAKTTLSNLVEHAEQGEEIIIARAGRPVAKLVALNRPHQPRELGWLDGQFSIPDDFNRALPESMLRAFEGRKK